jgi:hypothetical protein
MRGVKVRWRRAPVPWARDHHASPRPHNEIPFFWLPRKRCRLLFVQTVNLVLFEASLTRVLVYRALLFFFWSQARKKHLGVSFPECWLHLSAGVILACSRSSINNQSAPILGYHACRTRTPFSSVRGYAAKFVFETRRSIEQAELSASLQKWNINTTTVRTLLKPVTEVWNC